MAKTIRERLKRHRTAESVWSCLVMQIETMGGTHARRGDHQQELCMMELFAHAIELGNRLEYVAARRMARLMPEMEQELDAAAAEFDEEFGG